MSLYTSIYFTPVDRKWIAPAEVILKIASFLGAATFDFFTVHHEVSTDPTTHEEERYEETLTRHGIPILDALPLQQAGDGYWTHMMFPFGDFMSSLLEEVKSSIPEPLSGGLTPWNTSVCNGHWAIFSYDEGTAEDSGAFCFTMSGNGCPTDMDEYLKRFLNVPGIQQFRTRLENLSQQSWTTLINLT